MWNRKMEEMPMDTRLLLLSKPKTKSRARFVAIAALEEWDGKKTLVYPTGYPELMRAYGCKKGDISEFEAWACLEESPLESRTVSRPGAVLEVKAVPIPPKIQSKMAEAIRGGRGFTLIEVLVVLGILAVLAGLIVPPLVAVATRRADVDMQRTKDGIVVNDTFYLSTVRYEGHTWIMNRTMDYFLHHPDCPCRGKVERDDQR